MQEYTFKVEEENNQLRVDVFLTKVLPEIPSRTFIKQLIQSQNVLVNGKNIKPHHKVCVGDDVNVSLCSLKKDDNIPAENIPLDIFYEDENLLIVFKPVGMLVHPVNSKNVSGTLVNALLHHCETLSDINSESRPGIVHRLDRDTSGLLVVAKDNRTHVRLARQFEKHLVKKQYLALVEKHVEFDEGVIDVPLARDPKHHDRKMIAFNDAAKEAKTFYRVVRHFNRATLVKLFPKTGRTHQLRLHMKHLGHPVLGDEKYGRKDSFARLALHAQSLGFVHPRTNDYIEFSTKTPQDFLNPNV